MTVLFTSNPALGISPQINPANHFQEKLNQLLCSPVRLLFVASNPVTTEHNSQYAMLVQAFLGNAGVTLTGCDILDERSARNSAALIEQAGLIVLAGGHAPTQNAFFERIGLADSLRSFDGVVIGISAGSMNAAKNAFLTPDAEGEGSDPLFRYEHPGLGLADIHIIPHYERARTQVLDGKKVVEELILPYSQGKVLYGLPDGSWILSSGGENILFGEAWMLSDGHEEKISGTGDVLQLPV